MATLRFGCSSAIISFVDIGVKYFMQKKFYQLPKLSLKNRFLNIQLYGSYAIFTTFTVNEHLIYVQL